jgi:hypothetical protein
MLGSSGREREDGLPRYLIEVEHAADGAACKKVVQMFLDTGSHYLSQAEWGCQDGVHKSWIIVEADDREQARAIVPPFLRREATVIRLARFFTDEMGGILTSHGKDD